jgi:DNA-binding response OmpR family regulator
MDETSKKKILIADDELSIRKLYQRELDREGYEIIVASDGKETLGKVRDEQPDLVILDIRMPGMDGMQTMSQIIEEKNDLPVIINSAYTTYKDNFMSWAAEAYCVKSSDLTELKNAVDEVFEKRSAAQ